MARKKVVFIIVEGPSDAAALETLLTRIFSSSTVFVKVMRCDITTELGVTPSNIKTKICDVIKEYAGQFGLKSSHFCQVIHLIDTDGAYVPDDCIGEDSNLSKGIKEQGIEQGIEQGEFNKAVKIAIELLKMKLPAANIVKAAELSLEQLREIAEANQLELVME